MLGKLAAIAIGLMAVIMCVLEIRSEVNKRREERKNKECRRTKK